MWLCMKSTRYKLSVPIRVAGLSVIITGAFVLGFVSYNMFVQMPRNDHSRINGHDDSLVQNSSEIGDEALRFDVRSLQDLSDVSQFSNHFERTSVLLNLLARGDKNTLLEYLVQSKKLSPYHFRIEVQSGIFHRLTAIDPQVALSSLESEFSPADQVLFLTTIFEEWSRANLQEAISQAQSLDTESKEAVVARIVSSRDDLSINELRDVARQIGCEWVAINILSDVGAQSIFNDPKQEWFKFVEHNVDQLANLSELQTQALGHILLAWVEQDGLEIVDSLRASLPSEFSLLDTITLVTDQLVTERPELAFDLALEMAENFDQTFEFRYLAGDIAGRWAASEPRQAFDATFQIEGRSLRGMLQTSVVREWAKGNPEALLDMVDKVPDDLQILVRQHALISIASTSPETVVSRLGDFSVRKNRDLVAMSIARNWARSDVPKLFKWIETDSNVTHIQNELKRAAFIELTRLNPALAMQEAILRPADDRGRGWEATIITRLVKWGDVDTAVELLPQVREGATRVKASQDVIEHLIEEQYDTETAADLFLQLNRSEITKCWYLVNDLTRIAPRNLYEKLDKIQPKHMRLYVASSLISNNFQNGVFTADELQSLEAIVESND